jgi:pyrimidine operon attenuation protein/uracil phosphoribosyltransferase
VTLAQRISAELASTTGVNLPVGQIDVTFHRDDLELHHPVPQITSVPFDITGLTIILVDDVLFSGRTVRAALTAINDLGRPEAIQLATLIDRGHRRLPIAADFIGRTIETDYLDDVAVKVKEIDGLDCVEVSKP